MPRCIPIQQVLCHFEPKQILRGTGAKPLCSNYHIVYKVYCVRMLGVTATADEINRLWVKCKLRVNIYETILSTNASIAAAADDLSASCRLCAILVPFLCCPLSISNDTFQPTLIYRAMLYKSDSFELKVMNAALLQLRAHQNPNPCTSNCECAEFSTPIKCRFHVTADRLTRWKENYPMAFYPTSSIYRLHEMSHMTQSPHISPFCSQSKLGARCVKYISLFTAQTEFLISKCL